jgi:hypothetical protein
VNKAVIIGLIIVLIAFNPVTASYPSNYELEWVLDSFEHPREYQRGVYDCTEMSICTAFFLQEVFGWNTIVAIGQCSEEDDICHAWVLVETNKDRWTAIETTAGGIGETRFGEDKYYHALFAVEWYEVYEVTS